MDDFLAAGLGVARPGAGTNPAAAADLFVATAVAAAAAPLDDRRRLLAEPGCFFGVGVAPDRAVLGAAGAPPRRQGAKGREGCGARYSRYTRAASSAPVKGATQYTITCSSTLWPP